AGKQIIKTISNNVMYKAEQTITFAGYGNNCIVKSGAITHVKASNKITFLPGFKVEQGAHLHASIEPIAMNQASLLKSDNSQTNTINYSKPLKYSNIVSTYTNNQIDSISICTDQPYIYPNPCKSILSITIPLENEYTQHSYLFSIFTPDGKIVKSGTLTQNANTIDVSDLAVGMYLIKIKHGDSIYIEKLLKN
ncbi:MAG TPA: T9SS type A sorting domain-containing protein, partial [Bacteroidales bacterium]|nr:T9SS type A sorting domain-containing protein [Bacteroidales bacterium]